MRLWPEKGTSKSSDKFFGTLFSAACGIVVTLVALQQLIEHGVQLPWAVMAAGGAWLALGMIFRLLRRPAPDAPPTPPSDAGRKEARSVPPPAAGRKPCDHSSCAEEDRKYTFNDVWEWLEEKGLCEVVYDKECEAPRDNFYRVSGRFWAEAVRSEGELLILLSTKGKERQLELRSCCWPFSLDPEDPLAEPEELGEDPCAWLDYGRIGMQTGYVQIRPADEAR